MARNLALSAAKRADQEHRPEDQRDDGRRGGPGLGGRRVGPAALKDRLTRHPLFLGTLIDASGTTTAVVARLKKTHEHKVIATVSALREAADAFAARHGIKRPAVVGPPVLLADGFSAIEVDGRRLAVIGMILIGVVTLVGRAERLVGDRADARRLGDLAGDRGDPGAVRHQAGALGRPAGGADHRADDARGQPPGDPLPRRPPPRGRPAPGGPRRRWPPSPRRSPGRRSPAPSATGRW